MKIAALSRSSVDHLPLRSGDSAPISRNPDPLLHPFSKEREYTRALTAAKMERMFAKPFVNAIECGDGVYSLAADPDRLGVVATGGGRGEVQIHKYVEGRTVKNAMEGHKSTVGGLCWSRTSKGAGGSNRLLSCSMDATVKMWDTSLDRDADDMGVDIDVQPIQTYIGRNNFNAIDHHRDKPLFATSSTSILIWDENRTEYLQEMTWHSEMETVSSVVFNKSETSVLASCAGDRTVAIWDMRSGSSTGRASLKFKTNCLSFNPMQPTVLLMASEDHNLYTFDMRYFTSATQVYKDHVAGVMSCDWAPTGETFVSGGWDRSLRLWNRNSGRSFDAYHTKRMQRVFCTRYTGDAKMILSGSDDGNLRVWKSRASSKIVPLVGRERAAIEYRDKLRERWSNVGQVKKVEKRRNMPKAIRNAAELKKTILEAQRVKEERRRLHTSKGETKPLPEKKKMIMSVQQ